MKNLSPAYLSQQRQRISTKLEHLSRLYQGGCSNEQLFHGQPATVYRKCGKANCKCSTGGENRHGPYKIVRIFREGQSRQITLTEENMELYFMAQRYHEEVQRRRKIVLIQEQLLKILDEIFEGRTLWEKTELEKK